MIGTGVQEFGGIDILINNAAISLRKSVLDTTLEEWQKVLNINLTGTFLCSKYVEVDLLLILRLDTLTVRLHASQLMPHLKGE